MGGCILSYSPSSTTFILDLCSTCHFQPKAKSVTYTKTGGQLYYGHQTKLYSFHESVTLLMLGNASFNQPDKQGIYVGPGWQQSKQ